MHRLVLVVAIIIILLLFTASPAPVPLHFDNYADQVVHAVAGGVAGPVKDDEYVKVQPCNC